MSSSPWGDPARVSSLKEALKYPAPGGDSSRNLSGTDYCHKSETAASNTTFRPPSHSNVRHNTRFRKWRRDYDAELRELHSALIKGLKGIRPFSQTEIENKITLDSLSELLYRKSSFKK